MTTVDKVAEAGHAKAGEPNSTPMQLSLVHTPA